MGNTEDWVIYHNANCSKSRTVLKLLQESTEEIQIVNYLKEIPSISALNEILKKLNINALDLVRTSEPIYLEKFVGKTLSNEEWIEAMHQFPQLIQRPIVVKGTKALIARGEEALDKLTQILSNN